jgi:hypothetical protein
LKLLFERTIKGTRKTPESASAPDRVIRTVLPLLKAFMAVEPGATERATVSLTLPLSVTEPRFVWVSALVGMRNATPMSVKTQHFSPGHLGGIG